MHRAPALADELPPRAARAHRCATLAALILAACAAACAQASAPRLLVAGPPAPPGDRPIAVPWTGYASSDACNACHPSEVHSWSASFHRTMTQVVTPASVLPPWEGEIEVEGKTYRLERRGEELWIEYDDPSAPDGRVARRVVLSTGSHHQQAYWIQKGDDRRLAALPIVYRIDEQRWMPIGSMFLVPEEAEPAVVRSSWNTSCLKCHSTKYRPRVVQQTGADTHVVEFGIACEACHGPAEEHVRANRDPLHRYGLHWSGGRDETIVNPAELPSERASEVCGQCHGLTLLKREREKRNWNHNGVEFRPGDNLLAQRDLEAEGPQYFWPDGMVRVSGREFNGLVRSPCYVHGTGARKLSCVSCHEMHPDEGDPRPLATWRDDQLKPGMDGDLACTQCHAELVAREAVERHTHHPAGSPGAACMNCHMPLTTWGLLKAIHSHEIDSPDVAATLATGRPNACNLCHLDRTLAWTAEHLNDWYGTSVPGLAGDQQRIAASILELLAGDAGQRALVAWHMGWAPAREASGTDWMAPYLAQLLVDPYDAVRFRAWRSLRELAGYGALDYGANAPAAERDAARARALEIWRARGAGSREERLLLEGPGALERATYERLLRARDDRTVILAE